MSSCPRCVEVFNQLMFLQYCHSQVNVGDIENEEKRFQLFLELLESSNTGSEFEHLVLLLQAWPPMNEEDT